MNIQQFQYILALAEHRHFETAAEKCFIAQSTLSTMILKFEEEIDITIFDRKKRPLEITPEGERIIERLHIIDREISYMVELAHKIKGEFKGIVKIACIPTIAPALLPLFLIDFARKHPDLKMEISEMITEEIIKKLKSRELDIGIVSLPIKDPELKEYHLYDEPFLLYDLNQTKKGKISVGEINMDNFWLMEEGHCMRTQVMDICSHSHRKINSALNINFKASSIDSLVKFVRANHGRTLLPYLSTVQLAEGDKVFLKALKHPIPYREVGLLTHQYFPKRDLLNNLTNEILEKVDSFKVKLHHPHS